ncbi:MAG: sulfurtransferase [Leptolyngbyaceae cyanobacterium T60_A2020_046]|nr:sulfurtransferase [Leptolyngbyaceae cyanobacterium T60_A2020_046]
MAKPTQRFLFLALGGLVALVLAGGYQAASLRLTALTGIVDAQLAYSIGGSQAALAPVSVSPQQLATQWVVSPAEAKFLIEQGAVVLDVRDVGVQRQGRLQGAIAVQWQAFSETVDPQQGNLLDDDTLLSEKLQAIGISAQHPVVVVGDPQRGWGQEGRVVWMLRTLGHGQSVMVDGGFAALKQVGLPLSRAVETVAPAPGDFMVQRTDQWTLYQDDLRQAIATNRLVILDTRERREFEGAVPYGERQGGHLPGAIHLHYRELLDAEGRLRPEAERLALLQERGIPQDAAILAYCTGGVRSAWLTVVLVDMGFDAKNYPGSMWEWSAGSRDRYPLVLPATENPDQKS